MTIDSEKQWHPPFCAHDTELVCPKCGTSGTVSVREKEIYYDSDQVEAFCSECHAELEVCASVEVTFSDPEFFDG